MRSTAIILFSIAAIIALSACEHVEMETSVAAGGVLEDAILISRSGGEAPREIKVLGNIDLSQGDYIFKHYLDAETSTHWWLIGHIGDDIVFTSRNNLSGSGIYNLAPYLGVARNTWRIADNIRAFATGTSFSRDWWAQTIDNHAPHVAGDGRRATLWRFSSSGASSMGSVTMYLQVPD